MEINDVFVTIKLSEDQKQALQQLPQISKVTLIDTISTGRSGASVFVVDVESNSTDGPKGRHILKINKAGPSKFDERQNHEKASQTNIQPYMALLIASSPRDKNISSFVADLYRVANGTLIDTRPLNEHIVQNFSDAVIQLKDLAKILKNWNYKPVLLYDSPSNIMKSLLGSLLKGGRSIQNVARDTLGVKEKDETISFEGENRIFPNPIAYALRGESLWQDSSKQIAWPSGHVHYDLHTANIICPLKGQDKRPILIDFSGYRSQFLIFYDYAYLELDLLLKIMPPSTDNARQEWFDFGQQIAENLELPEYLDGSLYANAAKQAIQPFRGTIAEIAQKENQIDDFSSAYLLAGVVAGLNWLRKLDDENERKLVLLLAAQRLGVLLDRLNLKMKRGRTVDVPWISPYDEVSDTANKDAFHRLRTQLTPALKERRAILILGPEMIRWLGFPSERELAQSVARTHSLPIPVSGDQDDLASFNQIVSNKHGVTTDQIRVSVGQHYIPDQDQWKKVEEKLWALAQVEWLAVIDWSFSPQLAQYVSKILGKRRQVVSISDNVSVNKVNLANTLTLPWIFLRGSLEESKNLVLGSQEWRLPRHRSFREAVLKQLFDTGPQDASTVAILLGCLGKTLDDLYETTQSAYQNLLTVWAIGAHIDHDPSAQVWCDTEDLNLVPLSPETFYDFLKREFPKPQEFSADKSRYVLELVGIETTQSGDPDVSSPGVIRRVTEDISRIVSLSVPDEKFSAFKSYFEVLYRGVELDTLPPGYVAGGNFYRGHKIAWKDVALGYDIIRNKMSEVLEETLLPDLREQSPKRVRLQGEPGAGTSTLVARIAWNVYQVYHIPVIAIRRTDPRLKGITDAILEFYDFVKRSFLLIAEDEFIKSDDADRIFEQLQSKLVPAVMLIVDQTTGSHHSHTIELEKHVLQEKSKRSFVLKDELDPNKEWPELRDKILPFIPEKNTLKFYRHYDKSLFINLLVGFEDEFIRLEHMVRRLLDESSAAAKELLAAIAFCNRYGHQSAPVGYLSTLTDYSPTQIERFLEAVNERLILVEKSQLDGIKYTCRHDLIALQILKEIWDSKLGENAGLILVDQTRNYITKFSPEQPGNQWQRKFVAVLVSREFTRRDTETGRRRNYQFSRLMNDIGSWSGRGHIYLTAAEQFPDEPHLLAQYGRFLYDEDTRFEEARKYLFRAFDLTNQQDSIICHMLGMSYRRELQEHLNAVWGQKLTQIDNERSIDLVERARHHFSLARKLDRENEYGYVSHLDCLINLIKHGFSQFGKDVPNADRLAARYDLQTWLEEAFSVLDEAETYLEYRKDSYLDKHRAELFHLQGDLSRAIEVYENMLYNSRDLSRGIDPSPIKRRLARCLYQRGIENFNHSTTELREKALEDLDRAARHIDELLRNEPDSPYDLAFWFRCVRVNPETNKLILTERLESYYEYSQSLDGAFYLMCLFFLRGLEENNPNAFREHARYASDSKRLAEGLTHRLHRREWLGRNYILVPNYVLPFNVITKERVTSGLPRIKGIIKKVDEEYGEISIPPYGQTIYFQPKRHDQKYYKSDEGKSVTFNIVFTYDKPVAYDVLASQLDE